MVRVMVCMCACVKHGIEFMGNGLIFGTISDIQNINTSNLEFPELSKLWNLPDLWRRYPSFKILSYISNRTNLIFGTDNYIFNTLFSINFHNLSNTRQTTSWNKAPSNFLIHLSFKRYAGLLWQWFLYLKVSFF